MDVRRHMTSGRLSEMFGAGQVDNDAFLRTLGWDRSAKEEYEKKLSPATKKYLDAYAKGVNGYLAGKDGEERPLEYAAVGVTNDAFHRTLGWDRIAKEEYEKKLSPATKKYLDAYAKGVNAYLDGKDGEEISLEYAALGFTNDYKPEPWTPVDSVAWLKAMAWD